MVSKKDMKVTVSAVVTRADGKKEDLGVISTTKLKNKKEGVKENG